MRISKIRIENFRSIQSIELNIPQICALVGPNNSGKSNILKAIQRVLERDWLSVNSFTEDDVFNRDAAKDTSISITFDPYFEYKRFVEADPIQIATLNFEYKNFKLQSKAGKRRLEQTCLDEKGNAPVVITKAPKAGEKRNYEKLFKTPPEIRESIPLIYLGTNRSLKDQLPGSRNSMLGRIFTDLDKGLNSGDEKIVVNKADGSPIEVSRIERFNRLIAEALKTLRTSEFIALENSIKTNTLQLLGFDPDLDSDKLDLSFSPILSMDFYRSLDLLISEEGFSQSATEIGDGFQNAITLAILQAFEAHQKRGAIFLIEEPEMFLHPQMQRSLYKTIRKISESNQVIYTTHSPHFVATPEFGDVVIVRKGITGTFTKTSDLPRNPARTEKLRKELDPERNELFFAKKLLLVEGDTEKLAFPEYSKRLGIDLDRKGATIVEVGGKRNLLEFANISTSFGIPTGIVYDRDSKELKDKRDEEAKLNKVLEDFAQGDNKSWCLDTDYEGTLKNKLGESTYLALCEKYPNSTKPIRARLIASDTSTEIPEVFKEICEWLDNNTNPND